MIKFHCFLLFVLLSNTFHAQIKSKPFRELKGIDSINNEIDFTSVKQWSFIISDPSGDSLILDRKVKKIINQPFSVSKVLQFDDETLPYFGKFHVQFSEKQTHTAESLEKRYNEIMHTASNYNLSLLGFEAEYDELFNTEIQSNAKLLSSLNLKEIQISVQDENGKPIPYTEITPKNYQNGTLADEFGKAQIKIPNNENEILVSSFGFKPQKVTLNGSLTNLVSLEKTI